MPLETIRFGTVGPPLPERRAAHRRGRRDSGARPERHGGLLPPARGHGRGASGRLVPHRRHRRRSTTTATCASPIARRSCSCTSGGKKIAPQPIEGALQAHALDRRGRAHRRAAGTFRRRSSCPTFAALCAPLGVQRARRRRGRARARVAARRPWRSTSARSRSVNATLAQFERIKKFALLPREFTLERRRADADAEGEATRRGRELPRRDRGALPRDGGRAIARLTSRRSSAFGDRSSSKIRAWLTGHQRSSTLPMMYFSGT